MNVCVCRECMETGGGRGVTYPKAERIACTKS